ncbi:uncharacterized protein ATC70_005513 [Mucor velutinosus]|uniref:RBR-type E3 ubiquitin transferase n=1 Tax=Mucor velutinosus TaxID=708070 RepID=A0AAN7D9N1_9FUNG|nr:hypothetical protein ATC70_005513 [Mucor velutinosus]
MNITEAGGNNTTPHTRAAKPQRRLGISIPRTRSSSEPIGSKRKLESCVICFEICPSPSLMKPDGCDHAVCDICLRAYYQTALNDTRYHSFEYIQCPSTDCEALFVSEKAIRNIFTAKQRNDWWTTATIKTFIKNKVECPFGDCKAVFDADIELTKKCTFAECYECRRGVCTACQSPWHPGVIKIVDDEEELKQTLRTAKEKSWTRCPKCQYLVERKVGRGSNAVFVLMLTVPSFKAGCLTIWCKCGTEL